MSATFITLVLASAVAALGIVVYLRGRPGTTKVGRAVNILLRGPRDISVEDLRASAARAWGVSFSQEPDAQEFVVGDPPVFMAKAHGHLLLVTSAVRPMVDDPGLFALPLVDPLLRQAYASHTAFISILCTHANPDADDDRTVYAHIAKLAAELLGDDCLALLTDEFKGMVLMEAGLDARLRAEPIDQAVPALFTPTKVVELTDRDLVRARAARTTSKLQ